jgi:hypothetical protein
MKSLSRKLILFGIAVTSLFSVRPAQAFTVTLKQVGSNVVATGSGAIDVRGLSHSGQPGGSQPYIKAEEGTIVTGPKGVPFDVYSGKAGPHGLGSGATVLADTGSGDSVGINSFSGEFLVPQGYVSNNALSSSATWNNKTFASLGVTPGTYKWTWGTGANENFTVFIPGPAWSWSWLPWFIGVVLLGSILLWAARRRKLGDSVKSSSV